MKLQVEQIDQTNKTGIESKREKKREKRRGNSISSHKRLFYEDPCNPDDDDSHVDGEKKNRERSEKHANKKSAERYADIKMRNKTGSSVTLYQLCRVEERRYPNIDLTAAE